MADSGDDWDEISDKVKQKRLANGHYEQAKELVKQEKYPEALIALRRANETYPLEKYEKRILELEQFLEEEPDEDEQEIIEIKKEPKYRPKPDPVPHHPEPVQSTSNSGLIKVDEGFLVDRTIYEKLFEYQKEGIKWMYQLYSRRKGGILADDMGLGKTIQTIVFLSSLIEVGKIQAVLIIAPTTLLINWGKEFKKWTPWIKVYEFYGYRKERVASLRYVQRNGGVLLTTYGLARTNADEFSNYQGREFVWDYVTLDEGHKIKNPTKTAKALFGIPARARMAITGTPVQNNLKELWSLFDFVAKGTLLGPYHAFKRNFQNPITRAREKDARAWEKSLGTKAAEELRQLYAPYFLRRTKYEVFPKRNSDVAPNNFSLPSKIDWVTWIQLSEWQIKIYNDFLNLPAIKRLLLRTANSCLVQLIVLKKICDHPRLLSHNVCESLLDHNNTLSETEINEILEKDEMIRITNVEDDILIKESGKLSFLLDLMEDLRENGHRILVFSLSTKMLDIIQKILENRSWNLARLDGRVKDMHKRDGIVRRFQKDETINACLLTSQVGGVGLTLTAADRVIIYDPSWNPAIDNQAIDRAFRIGQKKTVVVYRLITCGSIEEKIYRRQVFKDSITKQTVGNEKNPIRYFSNSELKDLFVLDDTSICQTFLQLEQRHGEERKINLKTDPHRNDALKFKNILGISDHDLLYSYQEIDELEDDIQIIETVKKYTDEVTNGTNKAEIFLTETGKFAKPYELQIEDTKKEKKDKDLYVPIPNPTEIWLDDSVVEEIDMFEKPNDMEVEELSSSISSILNISQQKEQKIQFNGLNQQEGDLKSLKSQSSLASNEYESFTALEKNHESDENSLDHFNDELDSLKSYHSDNSDISVSEDLESLVENKEKNFVKKSVTSPSFKNSTSFILDNEKSQSSFDSNEQLIPLNVPSKESIYKDDELEDIDCNGEMSTSITDLDESNNSESFSASERNEDIMQRNSSDHIEDDLESLQSYNSNIDADEIFGNSSVKNCAQEKKMSFNESLMSPSFKDSPGFIFDEEISLPTFGSDEKSIPLNVTRKCDEEMQVDKAANRALDLKDGSQNLNDSVTNDDMDDTEDLESLASYDCYFSEDGDDTISPNFGESKMKFSFQEDSEQIKNDKTNISDNTPENHNDGLQTDYNSLKDGEIEGKTPLSPIVVNRSCKMPMKNITNNEISVNLETSSKHFSKRLRFDSGNNASDFNQSTPKSKKAKNHSLKISLTPVLSLKRNE